MNPELPEFLICPSSNIRMSLRWFVFLPCFLRGGTCLYYFCVAMDWVELYSDALLERDPAKFPSKAEAAKKAISEELSALLRREDAYANPARKALEEAIHNLNVLLAETQR